MSLHKRWVVERPRKRKKPKKVDLGYMWVDGEFVKRIELPWDPDRTIDLGCDVRKKKKKKDE